VTKLSVILATYNEEKNIKACLESVRGLADEIVIVDGQSTDKTVAIAKKYTQKIFFRKNPLMFHKNKQLAIEKATGEWILYLDADERVNPKLKKEILEVIGATPRESRSGYWIPRKNIIFGKWIRHTGWWPDKQLRLFRNGFAKLPCQSVHEQPKLKGETGELTNPLIHYNYQTVSQFVSRLNYYTENDKNVFLKNKKQFHWTDAIRWPTAEFLKRFFQQEGYKDGLHGLVLSFLQAFSRLVTFAKIWEAQDFAASEINFSKLRQVAKQEAKEWRYWFLTSKIDQTDNYLKKIIHKLKRRLIGV